MKLRGLFTLIILVLFYHSWGVRAAELKGRAATSETLSPEQIESVLRTKGKKVVTFIGYSGAEYEDRNKMLSQAFQELRTLNPENTVVNIGATSDGIGAVYALAKKMGFETTGIVSSQAKKYGGLSPWVDHVFYVDDPSWGGLMPGTRELFPASRAMVAVSDKIIGIGGGEEGRDEILAAKEMGKEVRFYPADMNHAIALEKAAKKGLPPPTDFKGAAGSVFGGSACVEREIRERLSAPR